MTVFQSSRRGQAHSSQRLATMLPTILPSYRQRLLPSIFLTRLGVNSDTNRPQAEGNLNKYLCCGRLEESKTARK